MWPGVKSSEVSTEVQFVGQKKASVFVLRCLTCTADVSAQHRQSHPFTRANRCISKLTQSCDATITGSPRRIRKATTRDYRANFCGSLLRVSWLTFSERVCFLSLSSVGSPAKMESWLRGNSLLNLPVKVRNRRSFCLRWIANPCSNSSRARYMINNNEPGLSPYVLFKLLSNSLGRWT